MRVVLDGIETGKRPCCRTWGKLRVQLRYTDSSEWILLEVYN